MIRALGGALLLGLLVAGSAASAELEGLVVPEEIRVNDRPLRLNGFGRRQATRFFVTGTVYVAALHVESPSREADRILESDELKQITLRYLYPIEEADMKRAWAHSFEQSCPERDCARWATPIADFDELVRGVSPGDTYIYRFFPDRVELELDGDPLGSIAAPGFSALLLATWIGPAPPTQDLKRALLGASSE